MSMEKIFSLLKDKAQTLAVAESCTGGALANEITKVPGASQIFLGSITAYANEAKEHVLHIDKELLLIHGAVSEQVALELAKNCQKLFSSTWAISTTGIAGPTGATADKPLGLVYIGIAGPKKALVKKFIFNDSRLVHREKTIEQALILLLEELEASA